MSSTLANKCGDLTAQQKPKSNDGNGALSSCRAGLTVPWRTSHTGKQRVFQGRVASCTPEHNLFFNALANMSVQLQAPLAQRMLWKWQHWHRKAGCNRSAPCKRRQ